MRSSLLTLLLLLCTSSTTCVRPASAIDGKDSSVFSSRLRARFDRTPAETSEARSIDIEVTHQSGGFNQELTTGENIRLDGVTFDGPQIVAAEYELITAYAAWNQEFVSSGRYNIEGFLGLGLTHLDMTLTGTEGRDSKSELSFGPVAGAQAAAMLVDDLELYARLSLLAGLIGGDFIGTSTWEFGMHWQFARSVAIDAGWYATNLEQPEDNVTLSEIDLELNGPFVRLTFEAGGTKN